MLRRTIPSIFIIMALVFLFSCSGSADKPDVPVESITLDSTEITLKAGETATLNATVSPEDATDKSLLWASDSESITVEAGVVTVSSTATAGEYTITVTSVSNTTVKTTCTVTVEAAAAGGGGGPYPRGPAAAHALRDTGGERIEKTIPTTTITPI